MPIPFKEDDTEEDDESSANSSSLSSELLIAKKKNRSPNKSYKESIKSIKTKHEIKTSSSVANTVIYLF